MPIYEYKCGDCGNQFERLISCIDSDLDYSSVSCESGDCGGIAKQVMSVPSPSPKSSGLEPQYCKDCGEELIPVMLVRISHLSKENLH